MNRVAANTYRRLRGAVLSARDTLRGVPEPLLYRMSPVLLARYRYLTRMGRRLNLNRPTTFDEKLLWLMLFWRHPLKTRCADKIGLRDYATELGLAEALVEQYGVYESPDEIDFEAFPDRFVLKCTHGSGFNLFCLERERFDRNAARRKLAAWLERDFSAACGEIHYAGIPPRIVCERFIGDAAGRLPRDYKLHCFHGRVEFTTVCSERRIDLSGAVFDHYDRDWSAKLPYARCGLHPERVIPKPAAYDDMVRIAEKLSSPFPYVRVDLYDVEGRLFVGEMTFVPCAGTDTSYADIVQRLGDLITLPEPLGG
jgi:hypothetical protein